MLGEGSTCRPGAHTQVGWIKAGVFSLSVCLACLPSLLLLHLGQAGSRQGRRGAVPWP